jgi:hypothetical protein
MTFIIMTLNIEGLFVTLKINGTQKDECTVIQCNYAENDILFIGILNVIMLSVILLIVIMMSVVAPLLHH